MIPDYERLAIVELIFFTPALIISIFLSIKHGFGRDQSWFFINLLSLCRVIGSVCGIAAASDSSASQTTVTNLFIAYYVCNGIGINFLILALVGLLRRVNTGLYSATRIPPTALRLVILPLLAAIILNAISGANYGSSDPDTSNASLAEAKAGSIIVLAVGLVVSLATGYLLSRLSAVQRDGDRTLLFIVAISLPFLAIRIIYGICIAFDGSNPNETFYRLSPNVWAQAFMSVAEEFIIVTLVLAGGIMVDRAAVDPAQGSFEQEMAGDRGSRHRHGGKPSFGDQV